jgi:hypothetical protein
VKHWSGTLLQNSPARASLRFEFETAVKIARGLAYDSFNVISQYWNLPVPNPLKRAFRRKGAPSVGDRI